MQHIHVQEYEITFIFTYSKLYDFSHIFIMKTTVHSSLHYFFIFIYYNLEVHVHDVLVVRLSL